MIEKGIKFVVGALVLGVVYIPLCFLFSFMVAWVPMLGWNNGLRSLFPQLPHVGYWQAFWITMLSSWVIHRPEYRAKE